MSFERKMYDVSSMNLKCATCSQEIKELPFQPADATRPVYCLDCNRKRQGRGGYRGGFGGGGGGRGYGRR
jgi:CxxC-x17-CxxC domain-containing protein